jgi:VWFA-related protein
MGARTGHGRLAAAIATGALLGSGPLLWAQRADREQIPAFRSGVELVTVDVGVVEKSGEPVRGLEPSDFVVSVGGEPRRVVSAEFVDTAAVTADLTPRPGVVPVSTNDGAGVGRLFAFVVDQNTIDAGGLRHITSAADTVFRQLTFSDRSALIVMPLGPNVGFTWAHDRVQEALQRVFGRSSPATSEFASLAEARDIANRQSFALRNAGLRYCGGDSIMAGGGGTSAPTAPSGSGSTPSGGSGAPSGGGTGGSGTQGGGQSAGAAAVANMPGAFGMDRCVREIQMQAETAWREAHVTSMTSLGALRQVLAALARVPGDKTVVLISGGWPMEDHEQTSLLAALASDAAAARATVFTVFSPVSSFAVSRRTISATPGEDQHLHLRPLETLAAMTGGSLLRAEVNASAAFGRLARELSGYYRLGIERAPGDLGEHGRRLKIQVPRNGVSVRAREIFDVGTFEDRNWAARLASALEAPIPATAVGLRVASYVSVNPEDRTRLKLVLTGEASRLGPGEATFQVAVNDLTGKKLLSGEQPLGVPTDEGLRFSANVAVPPGSYIVRVAVMDSRGRVGSVDHRVDVQPVSLGALSATGPMLVRVPIGEGSAAPHFALDTVGQDERLALEVSLEGDSSHLATTDVVFEIAERAEGPALVTTAAVLSQQRSGSLVAQGVADVRVLPPGDYVVRARVASGSGPLGEVLRAFSVLGAPPIVAGVAPSTRVADRREAMAPAPGGIGRVPPFALDHVLAPQVVGVFLDRVAARPDADSPALQELLGQARTAGVGELTLSEAQVADAPVAAFLQGLALLAQDKLDAAADAFRGAMRGSPDFYPAMVYLGACYAAGGKDKEAASAWRTALIREGDAIAVHRLLADALLRQGRGDLALESLERARLQWPDDEGLKRRFAIAAFQAGQHLDGLDAVEELIDVHAEDEPSLALALLVLYQALTNGQPVESPTLDRARMLRFADAYRTRGGPSLALVDTWVAAVDKRR